MYVEQVCIVQIFISHGCGVEADILTLSSSIHSL